MASTELANEMREQNPQPRADVKQLFQNSLDRFLAKDMKGWIELCAEDVVAEFPFAPEGSPSRLEGRAALHEYPKNYPSFIDVRRIPAANTGIHWRSLPRWVTPDSIRDDGGLIGWQ